MSEAQEKTFEQAMAALESIVAKLETGDVELEKAIELFQEGITLSRDCQNKLNKVEEQVRLLTEEEGDLVKKEFRIEDDQGE